MSAEFIETLNTNLSNFNGADNALRAIAIEEMARLAFRARLHPLDQAAVKNVLSQNENLQRTVVLHQLDRIKKDFDGGDKSIVRSFEHLQSLYPQYSQEYSEFLSTYPEFKNQQLIAQLNLESMAYHFNSKNILLDRKIKIIHDLNTLLKENENNQVQLEAIKNFIDNHSSIKNMMQIIDQLNQIAVNFKLPDETQKLNVIQHLKQLYAKEMGNPEHKELLKKFLIENPLIQEAMLQQQKFSRAAQAPESKNSKKDMPFPKRPGKMDRKDIKENGKLESKENIEKIKKYFNDKQDPFLDVTEANNPHQKVSKTDKDLKTDFSIIHANGKNFAVYYGDKKNKSLGSGAFGKAKCMQDLDSGDVYVLKIQKVGEGQDALSEKRMNEIRAEHKIASGQDIDVFVEKKENGKIKQVAFGMKLASGVEGFEYFIENPPSMPVSRWTLKGINLLKAYQSQVADKGFIHRDIKLENLFHNDITDSFTVIDWGMAAKSSDSEKLKLKVGEFPMGTPGYIAPELYDATQERYYSQATDAYALGVELGLMYDMGVFVEDGYGGAIFSFYDEENNSRFPDPAMYSQMKSLIEQLMHETPSQRPTIEEAIESLEDIFSCSPEVVQKTRRVAVLDRTEYLNTDENSPERKRLMSALQCADEVWILDREADQLSEPKNLAKAYDFADELKEAGVGHVSHLFSEPGKTIEVGMQAVYQKADDENKNNTQMRGLFLVSEEHARKSFDSQRVHVIQTDAQNVSGENYTAQYAKYFESKFTQSPVGVSQQFRESIIDDLQTEKNRLQEQYFDTITVKSLFYNKEVAQGRIDALGAYISKLETYNDAKPLTFGELDKGLASLQQLMLSTGKKATISRGQTVIKNQRTAVQSEEIVAKDVARKNDTALHDAASKENIEAIKSTMRRN